MGWLKKVAIGLLVGGLATGIILWKRNNNELSSTLIGKWDSAFYSQAPTTYLNIKSDGSFTYDKKGGSWHVSENDFVFESCSKMKTMVLHYDQDERMLSDGILDGISFVRDSDLQFEQNVIGRWSTSKNPSADATGTEVVLIDQGFNYLLGESLGKYDTHAESITLSNFKGKDIVLHLTPDKNRLCLKGSNEPVLTRIPIAPLEKAVLGKWSYSLDESGSIHPTELLANGKVLIGGKAKTWKVKDNLVVIENLVNGSSVNLRVDSDGMRLVDLGKWHSVVFIRSSH